jgi:hypothetical protein
MDRLRLLLDRPLDPRAGRAVVVIASAILLGYTAVFALGAGEPDPAAVSHGKGRAPITRPSAPIAPVVDQDRREPRPAVRRQDPQDVKGTAAARRADRTLRSHRALQHVPYRAGRVVIALVGARGIRAVLRITARSAS